MAASRLRLSCPQHIAKRHDVDSSLISRASHQARSKREVRVSGRRRHSRFVTLAAWNGRMRIGRDVSIAAAHSGGELAVDSDVPAMVDEEFTLGLFGPDGRVDVRVKVIDSNPQIVDGLVRHRLRLLMLDTAQ
jgi:hypothetical protein